MKPLTKTLSKNVEIYDNLRTELATVCLAHHDNYEEIDPRIVVGVLLEMSIGLYMSLEGSSKSRFIDGVNETYKIMTETLNSEIH